MVRLAFPTIRWFTVKMYFSSPDMYVVVSFTGNTGSQTPSSTRSGEPWESLRSLGLQSNSKTSEGKTCTSLMEWFVLVECCGRLIDEGHPLSVQTYHWKYPSLHTVKLLPHDILPSPLEIFCTLTYILVGQSVCLIIIINSFKFPKWKHFSTFLLSTEKLYQRFHSITGTLSSIFGKMYALLH